MAAVLRVLRLDGEAVRCGERELASPGSAIWVDCTPEPENLAWLASRFGFHPLALEDAAHADQRSKFEDYPGTSFMVLHRLGSHPEGEEVVDHELHSFLTAEALVTVHVDRIGELDAVFDRVTGDPAVLNRGPDFVLYLVYDAITDAHFQLADSLSDEVEVLNEEVLENPRERETIARISRLRHQLAHLRRRLAPQRDVLAALARPGQQVVRERTVVYFRDVQDHVLRITEQLDVARNLVTQTMEIYLSSREQPALVGHGEDGARGHHLPAAHLRDQRLRDEPPGHQSAARMVAGRGDDRHPAHGDVRPLQATRLVLAIAARADRHGSLGALGPVHQDLDREEAPHDLGVGEEMSRHLAHREAGRAVDLRWSGDATGGDECRREEELVGEVGIDRSVSVEEAGEGGHRGVGGPVRLAPPLARGRMAGPDPLEAGDHDQVASARRAARHGHRAGLAGDAALPHAPLGAVGLLLGDRELDPGHERDDVGLDQVSPVKEVERGHGARRLDPRAELPAPFRVEARPLERKLEGKAQPGHRGGPDEGEVVERRTVVLMGTAKEAELAGNPGEGEGPAERLEEQGARIRPSRCRSARNPCG